MSSDKSPILVVFVPGIMGSSLSFTSKDGYGFSEEIWGKDGQANLNSFHNYPHRLNPRSGDEIKEGEVIPYFENIRLPQSGLKGIPIPGQYDIYGSLMDFCRKQLGLRDGQDKFLPFPYNWLDDNRNTAEKLANFIRDQDHSSRLFLIAHSMGGIVCRLMLAAENNKDIAARTQFFLQIATPVMGSAKAYYSIQRYPKLSPVFDLAWNFRQNKQTYAKLQNALKNCYSLYQLLPHPDVITLYNQQGKGYSCLDQNIWREHHHRYIEAAIAVHQELATFQNKISQFKNLKVRCIFSDQHQTPIVYRINSEDYDIRDNQPIIYADGDDTVSVASARANSIQQYPIQTKLSKHMELCQNPKVHDILKAAFQELL